VARLIRSPLAFRMALAGALLAASTAGAQPPAAPRTCASPVGRDLPSGPIDPRSLAVQPFVRLFKSLDDQGVDVRAFLLLKDCTVILERYKEGLTRDHNHAVYSVTKSVVSTLVGIQLRDGRLAGIDLPVSRIMSRPLAARDVQWERASTLTLRNAMNMASGLAYAHNPTQHPIYALGTDRFIFALSLEPAARPGERFNYSDADASITGAVVASVAGEDLYAFARRALFDPLQMFNHDWWFRDSAGRFPGGWGLRLRPMDMLKLGQLYIQKGVWNKRKVFAANYAAQAWAPGVSPRYGLHWWIGQSQGSGKADHYAAIGFKGQRIYVFPDHGIVAAVVASLPPDEEQYLASATLAAIRESVAQGGANDFSEPARNELRQLLRAGFRGVTRVRQTAQDRPKLP
jgi:CubicO group peptidase (beta-lactamase class C family)